MSPSIAVPYANKPPITPQSSVLPSGLSLRLLLMKPSTNTNLMSNHQTSKPLLKLRSILNHTSVNPMFTVTSIQPVL